jgi:hypothetical protein
MKAFLFIFGLGLGFWIAGLYAPARGPVALEARSKADLAAAASTTATDPDPAGEVEMKRATEPRTARSVPTAFFINSVIFSVPNTDGLSPEDLADPQFAELFQRALLARARDRVAPLVLALELNTAQAGVLLEVAAEQAVEWRRRTSADRTMSSKEREEHWRELSRNAEARLASALTPEQMEKLAGLKHSGDGISGMVDSFAMRGAPIPRDRAGELTKPELSVNPRGSLAYRSVNTFDPPPSWMTEAQRRYVALGNRIRAAYELQDAVRGTWVKDPDLRDIWPE